MAGIDQFESMIAPIGDALLARASFKTGGRVLDLGCGGGATSLAIAESVGPGGSVTGIDISPNLIAKARERAEYERRSKRFPFNEEDGHGGRALVAASAAAAEKLARFLQSR